MLHTPKNTTYNGGKSGSGTYQTIINNIPPHRVFASLYAGYCGITRKIKPAEFSIINDLDPAVMHFWERVTLKNPLSYSLLNEPALRVLDRLEKEYKGKEGYVFVYLDPPYDFDTRKSQQSMYTFEMDRPNHILLLERIAHSKLKIMISHYPCDLYDRYLMDWKTVDFQSITRNGMATERIYMNYELDGRLHDYQYLGGDFREREALNRQRRNLIKKLDAFPIEVRNSILSDIASHYNAVFDQTKK